MAAMLRDVEGHGMSLAATIFLSLWSRVMRVAKWSNVPILHRIPLPGWVKDKADGKIDEALDSIEDGA